MRQIHERWPDYFFGRVQMAHLAIAARDFEKAREYLRPLEKLRRMHGSEFAALCNAFICLHLESGELEYARDWLSIWKEVQPDHPQIPECERRLDMAGAPKGSPAGVHVRPIGVSRRT